MIQHKHLIINAEINYVHKYQKQARSFLSHLVKFIGMKRLTIPFAKYVKVPGNRGMTAFVPIETSHIAYHIWDEFEPPRLRLDVYTCGELNEQEVINYIDDTFGFVSGDWMLIDREHNMNIVSEGKL